MIFNVNLLPARYGDSLWIEYGDPANPSFVLIDGGTGGTRDDIQRLIDAIPGQKHIELLVVTHIDRDHIEGILSLLQADRLDFTIGTIWFNAWNHLPGNDLSEIFGAVQGEKLSAAILKHNIMWNTQFDYQAVVYGSDQEPPVIQLEKGLKITLLSPTPENLESLKTVWEAEVRKANLAPGFGLEEFEDPDKPSDVIEKFGEGILDVEKLYEEKFEEDKAPANGSSIAFLAEFQGKRVLFAADAFPSVLINALNKLTKEKIPLDLMKLSHHASAKNTSPDLLKKIDCKKFAISTNGSISHHPARVTVARVIKINGEGTELLFNYRTKDNECWDDEVLKTKYGYTTTYPKVEGLVIPLL
ncbi:ComEC/Rec2 family competence protein [Sphingobacterium sp. LRF_L2]|uniref:ComEC/Rec2 family competence protein n=1 Tax=Sphingobacterium sp. LRF_L2 TaxID=3369421 RepID=UPI003F5EB032